MAFGVSVPTGNHYVGTLISSDTNTIDVNITKTYAPLGDTYHIINYILGIGIVFFFISLLFIEILSPKRNVQDED